MVSRRQQQLLRLIAQHGGLCITYTRRGRQFDCADGTRIELNGLSPFCARDFDGLVEVGRLIADPSAPGLFPDATPQRYLAAVPR